MNNLTFRQPRESRLIGGLIATVIGIGLLFFTTLVALQSFSESPLGIIIFLSLGIIILLAGLYFSICTNIIELDLDNQQVNTMMSCLMFKHGTSTSFRLLKEAGVNQRYYAGSHTEQSGTFYSVELRGQKNIELPGTRTTSLDEAADTARSVAEAVDISFQPRTRNIQTGSYKLGKK